MARKALTSDEKIAINRLMQYLHRWFFPNLTQPDVNFGDQLDAAVASATEHGAQTSGTLHAAASTSVAGFMSAADKTKLDKVAALSYSGVWAPGACVNGGFVATSVEVPGAAPGDFVLGSFSNGFGDGIFMAPPEVVSADTVQVNLFNFSGDSVEFLSGTLRLSVIRK